MTLQSWKTLARREILRSGDGRFLKIEAHRIELPTGQIIDEWPLVITPDYVNVVAVTTAGEFLLFRQTKYAINGTSLAPPGGYLEAGEDPLLAAQRELLEETGYVADTWTALGAFVVDGNRGCGRAHLFLARGARWQQPIDADDLEEQELLHLSRPEVEAALQDGEIQLLPWVAAVALALLQM
ncbi:MAG: NUDIX hydrolase [Caldilineaceae bacterium]